MKINFLKYSRFSTVTFTFLLLLVFQNLYAQDETNSVKANITLSFSKADSINEIKALVTHVDSSNKENPAKGIEVHFFIKKSFGLLPIEGDNTTTDENGEASVEFPKDLPGDSIGNVTVIAKVEDNDELGELETMKSVKWGKPVIIETTHPRALWASGNNAPVSLVVIISGMVAGVWAVIVYILYQLIQIKKSGTYEIKNQN
ncbi:MAG: hypothetical protein ABI723_14800 [Bacteroidia bacterium]